MRLFYKILIFALVLLIGAGGYFYYTQYYLPKQAPPEPELQTTKVRSGDIVIVVAGAGNLAPAAQVSIGFRSNGVLTEVNTAVGDVVTTGQLLASLDDTALRLQLAQDELNLQALISPEAIIEAEVAALNAATTYENAVEDLEYLISPTVWRWENEVQRLQSELDSLKADPASSAESLSAAENTLALAQVNLSNAQIQYRDIYLPTTFTYTYTDTTTGEELSGLFPPTENDISLARARVQSTYLSMQEAGNYAELLKIGEPCLGEDRVTVAEGTLQYKLEQACLDIQETELALDNTQLIAPIAGTITSLNATVGQAVGTSPLVTIATLDQLRLRVYIEETDLSMLAVGQPIRVTFDAYPEQIINGELLSIEPALQTVDGTAVVVAWASIERPEGITLLSGMAAEVEIIAGESLGTLLVPVQALRELGPNSYAVFTLLPDGQLRLTPVTVGLKDFANAEILSGLQAGDIVSTGTIETK